MAANIKRLELFAWLIGMFHRIQVMGYRNNFGCVQKWDSHTAIAVLLELQIWGVLCLDTPKWAFVTSKRNIFLVKMPFMRGLKLHEMGTWDIKLGYTQPTMRGEFKIGNPSEINEILKMTNPFLGYP